MLTKLAWDGECRQVLFHKIRNFLGNKIYPFFKVVQPNRLLFYLGSLLHIISSLLSHFRSWDYPEDFGFIHNSIEKVKPDFALSSLCMIPELKGTKSWSHNFHLQRRTPWKCILTNFKCKNEVPKKLGLEKQMIKNGVISLVFISLPWVMVLKLSKIMSFLQYFAYVSKKSKAVIATCVYASESSRFALLESGVDYYVMTKKMCYD